MRRPAGSRLKRLSIGFALEAQVADDRVLEHDGVGLASPTSAISRRARRGHRAARRVLEVGARVAAARAASPAAARRAVDVDALVVPGHGRRRAWPKSRNAWGTPMNVGVSPMNARPSSRAHAATSDTACCEPFVTSTCSASTRIPERDERRGDRLAQLGQARLAAVAVEAARVLREHLRASGARADPRAPTRGSGRRPTRSIVPGLALEAHQVAQALRVALAHAAQRTRRVGSTARWRRRAATRLEPGGERGTAVRHERARARRAPRRGPPPRGPGTP